MAGQQVASLTDSAFGYYVAYIGAGLGHSEALRLAPMSAAKGDDITNYPDVAYPDAD
jgi:hypothetical protein